MRTQLCMEWRVRLWGGGVRPAVGPQTSQTTASSIRGAKTK